MTVGSLPSLQFQIRTRPLLIAAPSWWPSGWNAAAARPGMPRRWCWTSPLLPRIDSVEASRLSTDDGDVGYMRIRQFQQNTAERFEAEL